MHAALRCKVGGVRGAWARLAGGAERWALLRHPEFGELLRLEARHSNS